MVKITKIYTRTGDDGTTGLVGGERVAKDSLKVEAYGTLDELIASLGVVRTECEAASKGAAKDDEEINLLKVLEKLQQYLFDLGSLTASPAGEPHPSLPRITDDHVKELEEFIDKVTQTLPELRSFVLPGGSRVNAFLHVARTVCRRAERLLIALSREETVPQVHIKFLNRLSDLLFALSRWDLAQQGIPEYLWTPGLSPKK